MIKATDLASGVIRNVRNGFAQTRDDLGRFQTRWTGMHKAFSAGVATFSAGIATFAGLGYLASKVAPFEKAMASLGAVTGANAEQMKALERAAMDAGLNSSFDPTEAAEAMGQLASAGYNVNDSIKLLNPTLQLAQASLGQLSTEAAGGTLSAAMKAFNLDAKDAQATTDKMVKTMNLFAVQAKDLPLGLANSSRGATALSQSLDETMISFGLVRNIMPRVESAATAVSTSMERMVKKDTQAALKKLGVNVVGTDGKFRNFLDILSEMQPAIDKMGDAKGAAFLQDTFGTEALAGMTAIMKQLKNGVTTASGEILKGADAVAYLRREMNQSSGEAAMFADKMADTLPGQMQLLKASLSTGLIEIAKPIANALKPMVLGIRDVVKKIVGFFRDMPQGTKDGLAKVALMITAVVTAVGGLVAGVSGIAILVAGLKFLGITAAGVAVAFAPIILGIAAVVGAIYAFKYAYERNLDGFADFVDGIVKTVKLVWDGLSQAFSQGGFSGAVRDELNKVENSGIKQFVINVYSLVQRLKFLFENIGKGLSGVLEHTDVFDKFMTALTELGSALGFVSENDPSASAAKWERWGQIGQKVGNAIGKSLEFVVTVITKVIEFSTGFIETFEGVGPVVDGVKSAFHSIGDSISNLGAALGGTGFSFHEFGRTVGKVFNAIVSTLGSVIKFVGNVFSGIIDIIAGVVNFVTAVLNGEWGDAWDAAKSIVIGVVKTIVNMVAAMASKVAGAIDAVGAMVDHDFGAGKKVQAIVDPINEWLDGVKDSKRDKQTPAQVIAETDFIGRAQQRAAAQQQFPAAAVTAAATSTMMGLATVPGASGEAIANAVKAGVMAAPPPPISATMVMDGETIGRLVLQHQHGAKGDGGIPQPLGGPG
ncbi:MAG: phage tail tape measure protein [Polyangiaceae bacterium]|nr:phage tail tape measure protein [Polyangiaceae bacterium]